MRGRSILTYAALALAVIVLLALPQSAARRLKMGVRDGLAPFQNALSAIAVSWHSSSSFLRSSLSFSREKERMQEEIANLRLQLQMLKSIEQDNADLRRQMGFELRQRYHLVLCEVVARGDASGWWETVRLNRGSASGIGPDMAVITTDGLVGKTTTVSKHTADVLLVTDPHCKVACKLDLEGVDSFGILHGTGVSVAGSRELAMLYTVPSCRMDYIHRDADVPEGTAVVTSERSGVYPAGLPVGRIAGTALDPSRLFRRAAVRPAAELGLLRYVFVVLADQPDGTADGPAADRPNGAEADEIP